MGNSNLVHPYIPNSAKNIQEEMLAEIGAKSIEDFYNVIPENLRFKGKLNIPKGMFSEAELDRHLRELLSKNITTQDCVSYLGAGCSNHHVPAICDEIAGRSEFLTGYAGEPYEDYGRFMVLFEYQSLMAELLDMEVVNVPVYDGPQASSTSVRMAQRITNRNEILISKNISPFKLDIIKNYCRGTMKITMVDTDETGRVSMDDLKTKLSTESAGFLFENPGFTGVIEDRGQEISDLVHDVGGLSLVSCDPISLGVLEAPVNYGADIVTGDVEGLGIHQNYGGGLAGFIATKDETKFVNEFPSRLFGITDTVVEGEYGFGDVHYERTSFAEREHGKEFVATHAALWGIVAAVYLASMGPVGMEEIGEVVTQKARYAMTKFNEIEGVNVKGIDAPHFKEFVVDFGNAGKTVAEVNKALLERKVFGGFDLTGQVEGMEQCALYCVTEVHTQNDLDQLVEAVQDIVKGC